MKENGEGKKLALFMLCILCVAAITYFICGILIPKLVPDTQDFPDTFTREPEDISPGEETTAEMLAQHLLTFDTEFTVHAFDIETLLAQTYEMYPELVMYYSGMSYRTDSNGTVISMSYRFPSPVDVRTTDSSEGFADIILEGLANAHHELYIVVTGCADSPPTVADAVIAAHNEDYISYMGYIGGESAYTSNSFTDALAYYVTLNYFTDQKSLLDYKRMTREAVAKLATELFYDGQSELERELIIHDTVINSTAYASEDYDNYLYHTAYSAALLGKSVCQGYAELASLLFDAAGIENYYVEGESKGVGHAWNIVRIGDGYYHVDLTWDDPVADKNLLRYDYFNLTDEMLESDHTWDRSAYPVCDSLEYMRDNIGSIAG